MRCFIAADVSERVKQEIIECVGELKHELWRQVKPQHMHITVKFLGDIQNDEIEVCKNAIRECAKNKIPFTINGGGAFPNPKYARVLFARVESIPLQNTAACIRNKTKGIGDERQFVPHLTIARAKYRKVNANEQIRKLERLAIEDYVKTISLKKSTLTPQGPVHADIFTVDL